MIYFDHRGLVKIEIRPNREFQLHWKFQWNLTFFDRGPVKVEIWPNREISVALQILVKFAIFWPPRTHKSWNLALSRNLIFSHIENLMKICSFVTTGDLWKLKFGLPVIKQFQAHWKFQWNLTFFDHHRPVKLEIFPYQKISVPLKIWLKFDIFWPPLTCETWNFG